jgi:hypothetical protein
MVAVLPVLAAVALAAGQVLAAGAASAFAGHAAEAGAMAVLQGGAPPAQAARAAVPGWSRDGLEVSVEGAVVRVALRPPTVFPALAGLLTAHATAVAGP